MMLWFKPKHKHQWRSIEGISFGGSVGVWLVVCRTCGAHGKQVIDGGLGKLIDGCPLRGKQVRNWIENTTESKVRDSK